MALSITELEVNRGLLSSNLIVPASLIISIGKDFVIVKDEVLDSINHPEGESGTSDTSDTLASEPLNP